MHVQGTDYLIIKNQVDACTSTDDLIVKNQVDACTSTDHLIVKNQVDACIETDTLNNETIDNEPIDNEESDNEASDNEPVNNEASDNEPIDNNKEKFNNQKLIDQVNMVFEARKGFLNNIDKMSILKDDLQDEIFSDNTQLMLFELNKINKLADESLDYVWNMLYGKNRENDEINDINIYKDKDIDGYMSKYIKIINDKPEVINRLDELLDSIVNQLQNVVGTNNYDSISKK